jgi:hypothetical protein
MVSVATSCAVPVVPGVHAQPPIVVVPIDHWNSISKQAIEFASRLSPEIVAIHVEPGEHSELLHTEWDRYVEQPFRTAGSEPPQLTTLPSPYRFVIIPIVQYILELSEKRPDRRIVVVIPELVEDRWYEYFLHNQRARLLEWTLLVRGNERIFTVSAPYYISRLAPPLTRP